VEVEAYGGMDDLASHARFGRTGRSAVMFGPAGVAYVYLVYGMYDCLNVVTGPDGQAAAVLVRAVEPLIGIDRMRADRLTVAARRRAARTATGAPATIRRIAATPDERIASGPGLVAAAFGIDRTWTGTDLCDPGSPMRLEVGGSVPDSTVTVSPRVGVAYAGPAWAGRAWRFAVAGHPSVSGPRG
ncbi:MAG: DNA-3-methyladenine glycosylase, partial [Chloroflexota bacterium]